MSLIFRLKEDKNKIKRKKDDKNKANQYKKKPHQGNTGNTSRGRAIQFGSDVFLL